MGGNQVHFQREKRCTQDEHSPDSSGQPALWKRLSVSVCLNQTNYGWNSDWNKYGALPQKHFRSNFSAEEFPHHAVIQPQDPLESSTGTSFSFRISSGLLVVSTNGINGNHALCQKKKLALTTLFTIQKLDFLLIFSNHQSVFYLKKSPDNATLIYQLFQSTDGKAIDTFFKDSNFYFFVRS